MTSAEQNRTVKVRVRFPEGQPPPRGALLHLRVEDVSRADAAAEALAEEVEALGEIEPGRSVTIEVPAGLIDPQASYSLFIHVDANGSGNIEPGDFISPAIHPVLTRGAPDLVEARLVRVGR